VLYMASNVDQQFQRGAIRVPPGKGIIGHVVQSGEVMRVSDVKRDERHYRGSDYSTGFTTRAILAVPLRSRQVVLGGERGTIEEHIIGGFEAINKIEGSFTDDDADLLLKLANQAATVLEIADLYSDANELFFGVVKALTEAIDAKDPYTEGHSQRVCEFSVEIARQMNLPPEVVHRIRLGSLLAQFQRITDEISNVLYFTELIIMGEDNGFFILFKFPDTFDNVFVRHQSASIRWHIHSFFDL